jgi:outer membrane protein, heavy metal efflux system
MATTTLPRQWFGCVAGTFVTLACLSSLGQQPIRVQAAEQREAKEQQSGPEVLPDTPHSSLSLEDLEAMAQVSNPSIARAQALVYAARGNWQQVGLPPNPVVGYSGQQIGSRGLAEQDGVVLNQEIIRGGKLKLNRLVAQQEVFRAEHELSRQQQRVQTDVRIAYFQVLVAQRQIDATTELMRIGQRGVKAAQDLFESKVVSKADMLQAKLEVENARILLQNSRNRHSAAWQRLTAVVGRNDLSPQALAGDVEESSGEYTWEETLERLSTSSPEIAIAMANIERARWVYQRAIAEPTPNLGVEGLVNWRDNGIGGRSDGTLQLTVPLPLWNRNQGAATQARFEAAAAERALEQLELDLQNRLAPVFERYASAKNQVERYREEILPIAQETLALTRERYEAGEAGEAGFVNLLTVQRTYSQTRLNYLESLRELRVTEAEMGGLLLSGSLEQR